MTEPHHTPGTDSAGGAAPANWPEAPAGTAESNGTRDSAVDALLDRLGELPELPVARHGEVYAGLHDDLLAALNESVTIAPPGEPNEQA
ncbi:hypothetical protein [Arthrobacter sp. EPSL27]|uniref:hypothetical protein n=1 Tax=Arthrobacter sp. EPSL27 TaxID=1745378 RepID=UPI0007469ADC|nr:hypothetical protein [Arthrobacter sp. EPSL27]KUM37503.1 hypothetical protein AR539_09640 [Arthrobacter sp. EPSL27]